MPPQRVVPIVGVDFTSAPSSTKPITAAIGSLVRGRLGAVFRLGELLELPSFDAFEAFLAESGPWVGGFDLPFGQPRELIEHEGWPTLWREFVRFYCSTPRERFREVFRRWCDGRPPGDKFAWRKADKPAGSSPAMRWTNPPVAWMMHAGIGRMLEAGLVFPAHRHPETTAASTDPLHLRDRRIALEAYPGFTARQVTRASYKSDAAANQTPARAIERRRILAALVEGRAGLDVSLELSRTSSRRILEDGSGDRLDAVISAMQAGHAAMLPRYGLPEDLDPLEGWIASVPEPGPASMRSHPIVQPLLQWFERAKRDLPWRRSRDPYRVWVSEIMLQQTQVERVKQFFAAFTRRFPTVSALARADEADVLAAWEGLGYYRRARQLHAAAKKIVEEHGGKFPRSVEGLIELPGIGRYTAAAIASIAMDIPAPIVEANSRRVLARLFGYAKSLDGPGGDGPIWKLAEAVVPGKDAGHFNQALMDLGATVCTPTRPLCTSCPLSLHCEASRTGRVSKIPAKASRQKSIDRHEAAIVARRGGRVLVVKRREGEWWAGLWDFPRAMVRSKRAAIAIGEHLGTIRHSVTHHRITLEVVEVTNSRAAADLCRGASKAAGSNRRWVEVAELDALAMSSPARRIARLLRGSARLDERERFTAP